MLTLMTLTNTRKITLLAFVLSFAASISGKEPKQEAPYNVLFIAVDDLRTELNCYGAEHIESPNIDRLAESGVRFSSAYVQQAICMASRASLMSGIRPERNGIYTGEAVEDLMPDVLTMNKFFRENGYTVSTSGKIYHFSKDTSEQFGEELMKAKPVWFARGYNSEKAIEMVKANKESSHGPAYEWAEVEDNAYPDGANTDLAVNKMVELKRGGKPFFLAVGLTKPHLPFNAPKKYWDMYPEESVSLSGVRERPEGSNKYTMRVSGELGNYVGMPRMFADVDEETALTLRRGYFACVSYADAQVGKLLNQLEALGLRENTIVVLWGDHGFKLGDYNSWCKWTNMDIDTRVPFMISVPGGKSGAVCDQMVETLDLYPTLADLCGFEAPDHVDGKSLRPLLENPSLESKDHEYAYTIWPDNRWQYAKTVLGYSVKDKRYNYVEWVQLSTGEVLERELYDHSKDPQETKNVVGNLEFAPVVTRLAAQVSIRKDNTDHDHGFKKIK